MIDEKLKTKLLAQYAEHGKLIIAYDYDDTVFPLYVSKDEVDPNIATLIRAQAQGHTLCLYTCRDMARPQPEMLQYLDGKGLKPDYLNTSPVTQALGAKIFYNVLLDDKCGIDVVRSTLDAVMDVITEAKAEERIANITFKEN